MHRIIRVDHLARVVSIATIVLSVLIFIIIRKYDPSISLFKLVTFSSVISTLIMVILVSPFASRKIWKLARRLNKSIYPDLNGIWEGEVEMESGQKMPVKSLIRQSLIGTEIDMHGETMKSVTIETTPCIERGQKRLYYTYRAMPKNPDWGEYYGSTIFDIRVVKEGEKSVLEISGRYYTDRKTTGRIWLRQKSNDFSEDPSYY